MLSTKLQQKAIDIYKEYLSNKNFFITKERMSTLDQVFKQKDHFSADELFINIQNSTRGASRSTVYKTLSQLQECGILIEADFGHGHSHYEIGLGKQQHIHLICNHTHNITEVVNEQLEQAIQEICKAENFKLDFHKTQLFGHFLETKKESNTK